MLKPFLGIILIIASSQLGARMYQWNDPGTGTTQFSGKPPVWYRSADGGPRVFVFDNGRVIDDTSISVSEAERERLRQQAFIKAEQDREAAREKLVKAKRLQAKMEQKRLQEMAKTLEDTPAEEEIIEEDSAAQPEPVDEGPTAEDMRKLVEDWEKLKKEDVRKLIESANSTSGSNTPGPNQ